MSGSLIRLTWCYMLQWGTGVVVVVELEEDLRRDSLLSLLSVHPPPWCYVLQWGPGVVVVGLEED